MNAATVEQPQKPPYRQTVDQILTALNLLLVATVISSVLWLREIGKAILRATGRRTP